MRNIAQYFRPKSIEELCGQEHLVSEDGIIYNAIKKQKLFSMILYGQSGIGKTTIANIIVNEFKYQHKILNATNDNKQAFIEAIRQAQDCEHFILVVDEIHRLNKDKQDILLQHIENGTIYLIGLTTANPYFSVNSAIRSRVLILELNPISNEQIKIRLSQIAKTANIAITPEALDIIANNASGDVRTALVYLESLLIIDDNITLETTKKLAKTTSLNIEKNGDYYYDLLSALQKSIRGSDVDAALLYLSALIELQDLEIITRRLVVICYEDIGLANPNLCSRIMNAVNAAILVGFPECKHPLSNIVIEMALSPKSNSAYLALQNATNALHDKGLFIPDTIKATTKIYKYPHDYPNYWVDQQYLPDNLLDSNFYIAKNNAYESKLNEVNLKIKKMKEKK